MNAPLTERTRVVVSANQVSAPVSGETVILGTLDGMYYGLDAVASRVWALVQQPRSLGELADAIVAEFDVPRERALADILTFCADLRGRGLIEVAAEQSPR